MVNLIDKRGNYEVEYGQLNVGEYFELNDNYYIKTNIHEVGGADYDLYALNILTGNAYPIGIKVLVHPVNIDITVR